MESKINKIREFINLRLYKSKNWVLFRLKFLSLFISLIAVFAIIIDFGFPLNSEQSNYMISVVRFSFFFFVVRYFIKFVYHYNPLTFFKETWFEGLIMGFLIFEGIVYAISGEVFFEIIKKQLGFYYLESVSNLFIQLYLFVLIILELSKSGRFSPFFRVDPAIIFITSISLTILGGTFMLMLPEMTASNVKISFIDALFTSTSATTVTGLIVQDTETFFTHKGHIVILLLMKLGGLNIVSFGAFFAFLSRFGLGIKQHEIIEDLVNSKNVYDRNVILKKILFTGLFIEVIGAIFIYFSINGNLQFDNFYDEVFFCIFHSVSAFNHGGISTLAGGTFNESVNFIKSYHFIMMLLIFVGGLGFPTLFEVFSYKNLNLRRKYAWKKISNASAFSLYGSLILGLIGFIVFFIFEYNNTLSNQSISDKLLNASFQSFSLRSAGFNTLDIGSLSMPVLIVCLVLMFIGGGTGSAVGGIKTSTFGVISLAVYNIIKGKENIEFRKKNISMVIVYRAFTIVIFFLGGIFLGFFALSITESETLGYQISTMDILFEQISAFCTVGLSTGITSQLSEGGKLVIITSMFLGRLGAFTIAFAIAKKVISKNYKYPDEHIIIG